MYSEVNIVHDSKAMLRNFFKMYLQFTYWYVYYKNYLKKKITRFNNTGC